MSDLTKREQDVYNLMIAGYSIEEISEKLCIVKSTVRTHRNAIYQKLLVNSRIEMMANVIKQQQVQLNCINKNEDIFNDIKDLDEVELKLYKYQLIGEIQKLQKYTRMIDKSVKLLKESA